MSRVGKLPIKIPNNVSLKVSGNDIIFESGKIKKSYSVDRSINVNHKNNEILLSKTSSAKSLPIFGTDRSNIKNIITGIQDPFKVVLEVNGVGYKVLIDKDIILLSLGYSHEVLYRLPNGISGSFEKPNLIILSGSDKMMVGKVASEIISFRKPEPYKGKGIKISGKKIVRKEGKKK